MSFFSRLFRKVPSPSPVSSSAPRSASSATADRAIPKSSTADRALAAAAEERALQAAIDARDVQAIARLVVSGTSTKVRQSAAHAIEDPELLRQLIRDVRGGNDKGVYKVLTSKRDALLEKARKLEQLRAEVNATAAALERHSQRAYDASYSSTLDQFEGRWATVAAQADPELCSRVQHWIDRSRETVAEHERQAAAQASLELAAANAASEAQHLLQKQVQASAAMAAEQERVLEEQKRTLAEKQQAEELAVREIAGLIRKARDALSGGNTARAAAIRRAVEEKRMGAPPLPANLVSQIQQLDKQLDELKDWKSFSVTPKRAELIEEMESLVGATLDPPALADRIKGLQDAWRTLSKGAGENFEADWQRFHEAAQKAYQPCSDYLAAQAVVREENLRRRDAVLSGLMAFEAKHNWEQPDWQAVTRTLRETKHEWRSYSAVDRSAGRQQQEAFVAVTASLQGRLDAEYARNVMQKQTLIERAQALLASEDSRKAIDAVKELQQKWRTVGLVPREADHRLWGEFCQHCDAVFQKRQQDSASYMAGLENNKAQAFALCERLEKIADLEGPELLESAGALVELRSAFEALGEFPRAETRELRNRFDQGLDRCKEAFARQKARDAERGWSDLFEAANQVRAYRLAAARGLDTEQLDTLKAAAETYIASVQRWPKNGRQAIERALALESSADLAANEAALTVLCVRAEILTDLPTPPTDQALRRDYQLKRLVESMGQGARADEAHFDTLALEWVGVGPVEQATYLTLLQRFLLCREQAYARVA